MLAALCFTPVSFAPVMKAKSFASPLRSLSAPRTSLCAPIKATEVPSETSTVDYSSINSVFPAEACEIIGGEACDVDMHPEAKFKPELANKTPETASESVEREYLEYNNPKTVFLGEACDDLGGEFCAPEYQSGVY